MPRVLVHVELVDNAGIPIWHYSHAEQVMDEGPLPQSEEEARELARENALTAAAMVARRMEEARRVIAEQAGVDMDHMKRAVEREL